MKKNDAKKHRAKELFLAGKTINEIATILNISVRSVQNYKTDDKTDWDTMRQQLNSTHEKIKLKEEEFLSMLIESFEKIFSEVKSIPSEDLSEASSKLEILRKFSKSYWSIKTPNKKDEKQTKLSTILITIKIISDIAIKSKNNEVIRFLTDNSDEIIDKVSNEERIN